MKIVIQKSEKASVTVDNEIIGEIRSGLVVLLGIKSDDSEKDVDYLVDKLINLRLFEEGEKYFEKTLEETEKEVLLVSQFTLYASCSKGRRPDFGMSAKSDIAKPLYEDFINKLRDRGVKVETGEFGAFMKVNLTNDGPVTIIIDSKSKD